MSEYWVSKKKYFCKYCDTYIAEDAPSRQQHENGMRHKGNVDRFIRGLYKSSEKHKKDLDEEKRDMARVEQAAQAAFAQDVASGHAKPAYVPTASTSAAAARKPVPKPSNPFANYTTAASLGYSDPDAERIAAEAEQRRTQGVAGEWEVVATRTIHLEEEEKEEQEDEEEEEGGGPEEEERKPAMSLKREAEAPVDEEDARHFKLRKRTLGLGEVYDPGAIPIKLKKKEEEVPQGLAPVLAAGTESKLSEGVPKWTKMQWRRAGEVVVKEGQGVAAGGVKVEMEESLVTVDSKPSVKGDLLPPTPVKQEAPLALPEETKVGILKSEDNTPVSESTGSIFRKRKFPAGVGTRGKRS